MHSASIAHKRARFCYTTRQKQGMTIRLYHGSQDEIVEPQYGLGQDHHDFGRGFYLTEVVLLD